MSSAATEEFGSAEPVGPSAPASAPAPPPDTPATVVRRPTRITLRRLDLGSVAKVSLAFYLSFVGLLAALGAAFWVVAAASGLIHRFEHLIQNLFGFTSFHLEPLRIVLWGLIIGVAVAVVGTALNVLAAFAYNLVARRWGGVRVTLADEDGGHLVGRAPTVGRVRPII